MNISVLQKPKEADAEEGNCCLLEEGSFPSQSPPSGWKGQVWSQGILLLGSIFPSRQDEMTLPGWLFMNGRHHHSVGAKWEGRGTQGKLQDRAGMPLRTTNKSNKGK